MRSATGASTLEHVYIMVREIFFTVVDREAKYKAKSVVDTVMFRGGDAASGWAFAGLQGPGLHLPGIALATVPVAALWLVLSLWLGRARSSYEKEEGQ